MATPLPKIFLAWIAGLLVLFLAIHSVLNEAKLQIGAAALLDEEITPKPSPNYVSGFLFVNLDSYLWIDYARQMLAGETWRIRLTGADGGPEGREVHWSQSISWLLIGSAAIQKAIHDHDWKAALEAGAVWVNPGLQIAFLLVFFVFLAWKFGPLAAALATFAMQALPDFAWEFHALRPDHQSLQMVFSLLCVVLLSLGGLGWNSSDPPGFASPRSTHSKFLFLSSGVLLAALCWVSAMVAITLWLMIVFSVLILLFLPIREPSQSFNPACWRVWGISAAVCSFGFYLLEYFPSAWQMRLEVNNPFCSLAFLASGEGIARIMGSRLKERVLPRRSDLWIGMLLVGASLLLPTMILFGPQEWYFPRHSFMLRLHALIEEFQSIYVLSRGTPLEFLHSNYGLLPLALLIAPWYALLMPNGAHASRMLILAFVVAFGFFALACFQVRWLGLFSGFLVWMVFLQICNLWEVAARFFDEEWKRLAAAFLIAWFTVFSMSGIAKGRLAELTAIHRREILPDIFVEAVVAKRVALAFLEAEGSEQTVMADPDIAPPLIYFAKARVVVSFYWENLKGLKKAVEFFASQDASAKQLLQEQQARFVLLRGSRSRLPRIMHFIATGTKDSPAVKSTWAAILTGPDPLLPIWLKPHEELTGRIEGPYRYEGKPFEFPWRLFVVAEDRQEE